MTNLTTEPAVQHTDLDELGPVDYIVVEFPAGASNFTGEMAEALLALVDSGTIRVIDILILTKKEDGTVDAKEFSDVEELGSLQEVEGQLGSSWPPTTSCTSRRPWIREALPASSSGRTSGPRHSHRRRGVRVAS